MTEKPFAWRLLTTHYRQPLDFTRSALHEAKARLDHWYRALDKLSNVETIEVKGP